MRSRGPSPTPRDGLSVQAHQLPLIWFSFTSQRLVDHLIEGSIEEPSLPLQEVGYVVVQFQCGLHWSILMRLYMMP